MVSSWKEWTNANSFQKIDELFFLCWSIEETKFWRTVDWWVVEWWHCDEQSVRNIYAREDGYIEAEKEEVERNRWDKEKTVLVEKYSSCYLVRVEE